MAKTTHRLVVISNLQPDVKHFAKPKGEGVLSIGPKADHQMTGEEYEALFPADSANQRALQTYIKQGLVKLIAA